MNHAFSILASASIKNPGISDAFPYLLGFVVVLVTLSVLMGLCMLIGAILKKFETAPAAVQRASVAVSDDAIPPEVVAVIAAAVATVAGGRRIMSIKPRQSSWGQSGRQRVHSSHSIRKS